MPVVPRQGWNVLIATLVLSLFVHGLVLLALSLRRATEPPKLRVVARVDLIDRLTLPKTASAKQRPKVVRDPPPLTRIVTQAGYEGTRPGVGGDPAPAPLSLKMELPKVPTRDHQADSPVLRDRSIAGAAEGNPFGDPKGVRGGVGEGGSGPGGTGGSGDGGIEAPKPPVAADTPKEVQAEGILKKGTVFCTGCHTSSTRPINIEFLAHDSGWDIRGGAGEIPSGVRRVEAEFEYLLDEDGGIDKLTILKNSEDRYEAAALVHFAAMHRFTPPGVGSKVTVRYIFIPEGLKR